MAKLVSRHRAEDPPPPQPVADDVHRPAAVTALGFLIIAVLLLGALYFVYAVFQR